MHLLGRPEGEISLAKPRCYWEGKIATEMEIGRGVIWLLIGEVAGCCDAMIKPMGSIKCGAFLDQPRSSLLCRKDPAPCS